MHFESLIMPVAFFLDADGSIAEAVSNARKSIFFSYIYRYDPGNCIFWSFAVVLWQTKHHRSMICDNKSTAARLTWWIELKKSIFGNVSNFHCFAPKMDLTLHSGVKMKKNLLRPLYRLKHVYINFVRHFEPSNTVTAHLVVTDMHCEHQVSHGCPTVNFAL